MKIYPDTKVYVLCPANYHTGGAELCHQLCSQLIIFGVDAYMCYFGGDASVSNPVHEFYAKYHLPYAFDVEDSDRNIFVVYEGPTEFLYMTKKIRRVLWWLSADNFLVCLSEALLSLPKCMRLDSEPLPKVFSFHNADNDLIHFVQSEYARRFVKVNGIPDDRIFMVEDYLNQTFLQRAAHVDLAAKKNFVAFNPKKGFEATEQLMKLAPDIDWRPIQNMTPAQVQELLAASKVYIDFGGHPGKDRIPREAAVSGCVVITSRQGAADNEVDINIPDEFKFGFDTSTPQQVIDKIHEVFENFRTAYDKQAAYRARIFDDRNRFAREVAAAFEIKNFPLTVAFPQGVGEESYLLVEEFLRGNEFVPKFIVDDVMSTAAVAENSDGLIVREQNRNFLRVGESSVEIITRADAEFLYLEGRIKKFALLEPSDDELATLKNSSADVLIFHH